MSRRSRAALRASNQYPQVIDPVMALYSPLDQGPNAASYDDDADARYFSEAQAELTLLAVGEIPTSYGDESYGAEDAALGRLGDALGGALGSAGSRVLDNPQVQASLQEAAETCKERAKTGVDEWVYENRENIALVTVAAVGALLIGHWMLSVLALRAAFPKRAFRSE